MSIAADPLVMTSVIFELSDPDTPATKFLYECHVSAVNLVPSQEIIEYQTLCPDGSFTALGKESFTVEVTSIQDWSADGLSRFLWENAGREAAMRFAPYGVLGTDTPQWTANVVLPRPNVGGEVSTFATSDLVFPVTGVPALAVV